jgi:hypothetical protein
MPPKLLPDSSLIVRGIYYCVPDVQSAERGSHGESCAKETLTRQQGAIAPHPSYLRSSGWTIAPARDMPRRPYGLS